MEVHVIRAATVSERALLPEAGDLRSALGVALAACAVTMFAALVVAVTGAPAVRDALDFGFAGVPRRLDEALSILASNARLMAAVGGAIVVVQSARIGMPNRDLAPGGRFVRAAFDVLVAAAVIFNASVVGAAVGAYGGRMIVAMLPHGPIEVAAYALALALYLRARVDALRRGPTLRLATWAVGLLTLAAFVETYAHF